MHTFEEWKKKLIIVRGGGDIATGTIYKLHQSRFPVLVLEIANPSCIRRTISFCEAVFDKEVEVEGVIAKRADSLEEAFAIYEQGQIPVIIDESGSIIQEVHPPVVVDAILAKLKVYVDDPKFQQEFMNIKYQNKLRLAKYIKEHNGIDVDPRSIFDVQVKRLHEYKRQLLNILHVMYLYNQLKDNPNMDMVPRTFIFGAKAAAGYQIAKKTIKLINSVADVINNDKSINGKLKVVFIEDYRVSNAELIFAAADVSEQISTASKEASGTGNMKFMLNGALTLGTMDGANVEIVEEVGKENAFIFGLSADEVINYENNGGYNPEEIFNTDQDIRRVLMQLINGYYSPQDPELFRDIYNSLLNTKNSAKADTYFILKDFRSYAEAQKRVEAAYRDENWWARAAMLNTASAGKFSSDRTIEEYVRDIWHLEKIRVDDDDVKAL